MWRILGFQKNVSYNLMKHCRGWAVPINATRAYRKGGTAPLILNLGTRWRWVVGLSSTSIVCNTGLTNLNSFIHSTGICWMRRFLAVLWFFIHSPVYTPSFHPLPFSLTSSCHLFIGLLLSLVVSSFIYNTSLEIIFSSIPSVHAQSNATYLTL